MYETQSPVATFFGEVLAAESSQRKWDLRFLELARLVASWSKDPSTKTGAVITRGREIVSLGYNGLAMGVRDDPSRYSERVTKLQMVVHAEVNAIVLAKKDLTGCTLYTWPFMSCSNCAGIVIQSGIVRCVAPPIPPDKAERWAENMGLARQQFEEAGMELVILES